MVRHGIDDLLKKTYLWMGAVVCDFYSGKISKDDARYQRNALRGSSPEQRKRCTGEVRLSALKVKYMRTGKGKCMLVKCS